MRVITVILVLFVVFLLMLIYFYRRRFRRYVEYKQKLEKLTAEEIYYNLCCFEFPSECFYGIKLAFYRAFVSPTISSVYTQTNLIASETEKRVHDTDILIHSWIDNGLQSEEADASFKQLNRIHDQFKDITRNEDFIYILCCFIVDTIRLIDVFGWRPLNTIEKRALFLFYEQVGEKMNLTNRPTSLEDAYNIVNDYIESDIQSRDTEAGRVLKNAIDQLLEKWHSRLFPPFFVRNFLHTTIYIVGGPTFHKKLGLKPPSQLSLLTVYTLAKLRQWLMHFIPPRKIPRHLSDILMRQDYMCPAVRTTFVKVGPHKIISTFPAHN